MTVNVDLAKLKTYKETGDKKSFNRILTDFLPHLRKLVRHKLRQMETREEIPRNMYFAQDIVDDVYLKVFDEFQEGLIDPDKLKIKMYALAREILLNLKEKHTSKRVSVETLLAEETRELEEKYTADAEGEIVLVEDLDDISYHQDEYKENILVLEEQQIDDLVEGFGLTGDKKLSEAETHLVGKAYNDLPELSRSVVEHYAFAKFTTVQIAEIHGIPVEEVEKILEKVKTRFKGLL